MRITPVKYNYHIPYTQKQVQTPTFAATKVRKLNTVCETGNAQFLNNDTIMLKEPMPFFDGLKELAGALEEKKSEREATVGHVYKLRKAAEKLDAKKFGNRKVHGIVGTGSDVIAVKLDKDEVLCLTRIASRLKKCETENREDFDIPVLDKGIVEEEEMGENVPYDWRVPHKRFAGWYIAPLAEPVTEAESKRMYKKLQAAGRSMSDWKPRQLGKIGDKIYLLDYYCVRRTR